MPKLTKHIVESTDSSDKDVIVRDSEIKGFILKVTPKGKRVYMLYYRTKEGRERRPAIGVHGQITCDEARTIAKQWIGKINTGGDPSLDKKKGREVLSMREFSEKYMTEYAKNKKASGRSIDERLWRLHINPVLGKHSINAITRQDIARLKSGMSDTPANANRTLALLKKAFSWAIDEGLLKENPASSVSKFKEEGRERFLSGEELTRLSDTLSKCEAERSESESVILAIRLLLLTGCRRNEILELQWSWISFEHGRIDFPDSKTGRKTVYLNPPAINLLNETNEKATSPYVCVGKGGEKHLVNIQKAWVRIRKRANLEDVRIHDLRHNFASMGAASGLNLLMIGKLLGHSQARTTERYAHLIGDPLREATNVIGNQIAAAMQGNRAEVLDITSKKHTS